MSDVLYAETTGTTCYIGAERGTVTGIRRSGSRRIGAFIQLDERPVMLYATLGETFGDRDAWNRVAEVCEISRDEFDQLNGLAVIRHELGWREVSGKPIRNSSTERES